MLGVSPVVGRDFAASENHAPVAIISHALWMSDFGGDTTAVGRTLSLDDKRFTVIGVMPADFAFPDAGTDAWIPISRAIADAPAMAEARIYRAFSTVARLARVVQVAPNIFSRSYGVVTSSWAYRHAPGACRAASAGRSRRGGTERPACDRI